MHNKPSTYSQNIYPDTPAFKQTTSADQYGSSLSLHPGRLPFSVLHALPAESLTHVSSFLDPRTLLQLGCTSKRLADHVRADATWHAAFLCQFLGITPEEDLHGTKSLLLRRAEHTWRKEFIVRWTLRR
jgi:hypothetical protein